MKIRHLFYLGTIALSLVAQAKATKHLVFLNQNSRLAAFIISTENLTLYKQGLAYIKTLDKKRISIRTAGPDQTFIRSTYNEFSFKTLEEIAQLPQIIPK